MQKWTAFWLLGFIWGSSYLLIHIGVRELSPFQLVFMRTTIAAVGLNMVLFFHGKQFPRQWKQLWPLFMIGIGNTTIPFVLISWGEKSVASGLASILQTTETLFVFIIAHFMLEDERMTLEKTLGLSIGFGGVVVITSPSWSGESLKTAGLSALLAIVAAQVFYAFFVIYTRKVINSGVEPIVISSGSMSAAALTSGVGMIFSPLLGGQAFVPITHLSHDTMLAVLVLGVVNTFIAYLLAYWTLQQIGASQFGMISYVILVVGVTLGVIVLGEALSAEIILGAILILSGVVVTHLHLFPRYAQALCETCVVFSPTCPDYCPG